jgi:chromate transporter
MTILIAIILQFGLLSLLAFGGANAILPEIHRIVVETNHWMSSVEFAHMFAISQATPGPNAIIVTLIGWQMAGFAGAVAATLAICGPSSVLIYIFMHYWKKISGSPWRNVVQVGVAPLAVGLVLASGIIITQAADETMWAYVLTGLTMLVNMFFRFNPIWLIAAGALLGLSGIF